MNHKDKDGQCWHPAHDKRIRPDHRQQVGYSKTQRSGVTVVIPVVRCKCAWETARLVYSKMKSSEVQQWAEGRDHPAMGVDSAQG